MFSRIREHFGIAGLVVAIVALVAALGGAAIAGNSDGGNATASAKGKKGPKGPKGAKGAKGDPGPAGPAGPQGAAGANGKDGANGLDGEAGAKGATGKNGTNGTNGVTGPTGADGSDGATGPTGFSGFTATLPPGETETGAWGFGSVPPGGEAASNPFIEAGKFVGELIYAPISFSIPLAAGLPETNVHYIKRNGEEFVGPSGQTPPTACLGSDSNPTAAPGHLCIYVGEETTIVNMDFSAGFPPVITGTYMPWSIGKPDNTGLGAGPTGALLGIAAFEERAWAFGSWAVTAPTS